VPTRSAGENREMFSATTSKSAEIRSEANIYVARRNMPVFTVNVRAAPASLGVGTLGATSATSPHPYGACGGS